MTLVVKTKSHGEIEAGFYSIFTKLTRLGKYTFEVKDLCDLAQYLANNPETKELQISGYHTDKFWEMEKRYIESFGELLSNSEDINKSVLSELSDIFFKQNQGKISLEERADLMTERRAIPVKIGEDRDSLKIGEYELEDIHFGRMIHYLARGGFVGWSRDKPSFAEPTLSALKESKNPLYKKLQEELR